MSGAAVDAAAPSKQSRPRLLLALLALSIALNLFFIAGAAWFRLHGPARWQNSEQRYQRMAAELDLDAQQRIAFDRYVAAMRARTANMQLQMAPLIDSAWAEIAQPQADAVDIMRLFDEAAGKRREYQREAITQTLAFLAVLSPEQRTKFSAIARPHPPWLRSHPPAQ